KRRRRLLLLQVLCVRSFLSTALPRWLFGSQRSPHLGIIPTLVRQYLTVIRPLLPQSKLCLGRRHLVTMPPLTLPVFAQPFCALVRSLRSKPPAPRFSCLL